MFVGVDVRTIPCGSGASTNAPWHHMPFAAPLWPNNLANFINSRQTKMVEVAWWWPSAQQHQMNVLKHIVVYGCLEWMWKQQSMWVLGQMHLVIICSPAVTQQDTRTRDQELSQLVEKQTPIMLWIWSCWIKCEKLSSNPVKILESSKGRGSGPASGTQASGT